MHTDVGTQAAPCIVRTAWTMICDNSSSASTQDTEHGEDAMTAYHADSTELEDKEILSWELFGQAQEELAQQIADSDFSPEVLVAVARGGMLPGGALTYSLGVKLTDAINVEFYTDVNETLADPILLAPLLDTDSIRGRRILVVDDVADSGRTLALVLKLLRGFGAEVRSAVLYTKPRTVVQPDFSWRTTDKWIVFPWSAKPPVTARS